MCHLSMKDCMLTRFYFLFALIISSITQELVAQDYRLLEGDIFLGFGPVINGGDNATFIFGYEPRVNVSDKVSLSARVEFGFIQEENSHETYTSSFSSLELFGDYYLINKKNQRVFVGFGAGIMGPPNRSNSFGISPRLGVEREKFRLSLTFNQMPLLKDSPKYIGLTFGLNLGGKSRQLD